MAATEGRDADRASNDDAFAVRNLRFDLREVPRFWHGGRKSVSAFFDNLSIFFPAGERFFIQSVKAHANRVRDPKLAREVRTFYGQEAIHSREHVRYNEMLARQGYPVASMDRRVERLLAAVAFLIPLRWQLGVTCALEHFTALMADWLLASPALLEKADPTMAALWRWHAAEENEHKAVAFDLFRTIGGTWIERCLIMVVATVIFWGKVLEHQIRMMHADGTLWSLREWKELVSYLLLRRDGMLKLVPSYLAYYVPGFHPWKHDNRELLFAWQRELESSPVYLRSTRDKAAA